MKRLVGTTATASPAIRHERRVVPSSTSATAIATRARTIAALTTRAAYQRTEVLPGTSVPSPTKKYPTGG
jgi:hypothetical protein